MTLENEQNLIHRVKKSDEEAFHQLYTNINNGYGLFCAYNPVEIFIPLK